MADDLKRNATAADPNNKSKSKESDNQLPKPDPATAGATAAAIAASSAAGANTLQSITEDEKVRSCMLVRDDVILC